jgi:tetratricopeptide (TPR) repeat protein
MTKALVGLAIMGTLALPATVAAQDPIASRVQRALDSRLVQPECKIEGGDFHVSSGRTYLKTAIEGTSDDVKRQSALRNGVRVVTEAITSSGQDKTAPAWYWLGRLYLRQGDLLGADSAFTHALALAPDCKQDIDKYRYRAWAALVNAASTFRQSKQDDSALVLYRAANSIYRDAPLALVNMADMFSLKKQNDSAAYYFGLAAATQPTDAAQVKLRDQAAFNHGVLLLNAGKPQEALTAFRRYVALQPDDASGKKALAQAFRAVGQTDSAQALERELVASAAPGTASEDGVSENDLMDIAVKQFNDKNYKEAAATFGRVLTMNPWNRDAVFNQANAYLGMQDGADLATAAERLATIEPSSEYAQTLRAQGYKLAGNQDGLFKAIVTREALLVNVEIESLTLHPDGATLSGKATGREARDENNKLLPAKPQTLSVDFLGNSSDVVSTVDVQIPALKPGETLPLKVEGKGSGIHAWRYRLQ